MSDKVKEVQPLYDLKGGTPERTLAARNEADHDANYKKMLKKEVLNEFAAEIHAKFTHYMDRNNIDFRDKKNLSAMLASDAFQAKKETYASDTLEELLLVEGRLRYLKSVIERLEAAEIEDESVRDRLVAAETENV